MNQQLQLQALILAEKIEDAKRNLKDSMMLWPLHLSVSLSVSQTYAVSHQMDTACLQYEHRTITFNIRTVNSKETQLNINPIQCPFDEIQHSFSFDKIAY